MLGAVIMVIVLVIVLPVLTIASGGVLAGLIGAALKRNGEKVHAGSELIELND
jgi:hypothetical protein